ncbi:hypothetical protein A3F27_02075 [Candidatus Kaiserbacteria bacterium RIFCSPHIGHO2_12_FULL_53_13]|uniref:Uncharacterized protein n=1 Tax=Candidatus Kaiserbacteria bacterium RIFCSPHIGHO2_12_FULL_53_13 TaxID=1798502 RepID=A0A1F6ECA9_9BACT|nr:MAG: hypothetical protein A3F27_02075 [Candidatus Kaiserbacteria bacterium RIFCSPHIGHO2_12_FULL_53_13]OGG74464.1 MAG: hypothetical protein A3A37_02325 [Candidatus Kaiserbacteria bacterium RIFCSPLOWO2_01_FULL_52_36]
MGGLEERFPKMTLKLREILEGHQPIEKKDENPQAKKPPEKEGGEKEPWFSRVEATQPARDRDDELP